MPAANEETRMPIEHRTMVIVRLPWRLLRDRDPGSLQSNTAAALAAALASVRTGGSALPLFMWPYRYRHVALSVEQSDYAELRRIASELLRSEGMYGGEGIVAGLLVAQALGCAVEAIATPPTVNINELDDYRDPPKGHDSSSLLVGEVERAVVPPRRGRARSGRPAAEAIGRSGPRQAWGRPSVATAPDLSAAPELRARRLQLELSQAALARRAGVSRTMVAEMERGVRQGTAIRFRVHTALLQFELEAVA